MAENKRVKVKRILADPDLRRRLMVSTIQATQAREGIQTSEDQAHRAYYVVSEAEKSTFFRLDQFRGGKGIPDRRHDMFVRAIRGTASEIRSEVARRDFRSVGGSPLAYQHLSVVGHLFRDYPQLDPTLASAMSGLMTVEIDRISRNWWEIPRSHQAFLSSWTPFAKGGEFSRFYSDIDLLVDCRPSVYQWLAANGCLRNREHYGKEGLTWVPRTQRGFNVRHLPAGVVFGKKGPAIFVRHATDTWPLLGVLNSTTVEYLLRALMSFGSYEVGVVQKIPIPDIPPEVGTLAHSIFKSKKQWDEGNEVSTNFVAPWLLSTDLCHEEAPISSRLLRLAEFEETEDRRIGDLYAELNDRVYRAYGIHDRTRREIDMELEGRPPEIVWPQMEGKTSDQKRMEHVWRLLSFAVKRVVEADDDGLVPLLPVSGETPLLDRVHAELAKLFPARDVNEVEVEIVNELKRKVKGYDRGDSIQEWLENQYFAYHASLYKDRPIFWHISSRQGKSPAAFSALVHYHRFDKDRMAKLRGVYLREALTTFRREAALASQQGRAEDRLEWQAKVEEAEELDRRLQKIQEGFHEGAEDYRILTPWKSENARPKGWDPDINDGVKVNIEPLQRAGVLRIAEVV